MRPPVLDDSSIQLDEPEPRPRTRPFAQFLGQVFGCGCIRHPKSSKTLDQIRQESNPLTGSNESIRELECPVDGTQSGPKRSVCGWPLSTPWLIVIAVIALAILGLVLSSLASALGLFGAASPAEPAGGSSPSRVRITNGCSSEAMWVSHIGEEGLDPQNIRIEPLQSHDFTIPDEGLQQTRYWTKWRCLEGGVACGIGDSGGPGQVCDRSAGCGPPVDTKFEAIFGAKGQPCNTTAEQFDGCDFVDVSLKDGFTVPFELEIKGDCRGSSATDTDKIHQVVTCTELNMETCPTHEDLGDAGDDVDLRAINPLWGTYAGCYSPCSKLTLGEWAGRDNATQRQLPIKDATGANAAYCCPTGRECRGGPVENTDFVKGVRAACPGVNSYAYDRGLAVGTCPAGTRYQMIFYCPPETGVATPKQEAADG